MFAEHQPQLARLGRTSPGGLARIATFALLTIRQPLRIACADYKLVRNGDDRYHALSADRDTGTRTRPGSTCRSMQLLKTCGVIPK
jgi:hypothetical protein